ncbi:MAG TPA: type II toxin-antitoxin system HicB family antitoxin, partial [Bryobacteraceae bacterium]|nr:type II toxin-antitoxin system HicB family antitoxin [Bryobacteraceae bacterium]
MNGGEFRRKAKRFADRKGLAYRWVPARGVGSHGTVYIGSRKTFAYPAWFRPDEDRRPVVSFPDFPHAHTDGRDMRDAMEEAIDCLGSVVAQYMAEKAEIPFPSAPKRGQKLVPVPLWIAGKLGLYLAMCEKG